MLTLPEEMQARLNAGTTTLCWCWRVTRADGTVFGFTEHDADLIVDGVTYRAATGFVPGDLDQAADFAAGQASIAGIFDAASLTEADLDKGLWDGAAVELFWVDWSDPSLFVRVWTGELGEVRRGKTAFEADLAGPARKLDRTMGRVYSRSCDAELGDARCGVDLDDPAFRAGATVTRIIHASAFEMSGLDGHAPPLFADGGLVWASGGNAGGSARVRVHRAAGAATVIELSQPPALPVEVGDTATLIAGCDKRLSTCRDVFGNTVNFRGCPFMPGNDALIAAPSTQHPRDGSSRGITE
ncbi:DUF2163 domain-containing protein [Hyphobacterium marinum]|uniref:DUF2163 domain-containing protein n=1 Tax=Hyphobacterium marinum TaxID=3116574 RepID=A0ABU7M0J7_9PROT|nr:DUF2163 domain-containing protein [Hyphobacterium sp. Y6023]MEE2567323.1 DUF2163 domain-containing protein [Hyphobacterium sp. Y6023]